MRRASLGIAAVAALVLAHHAMYIVAHEARRLSGAEGAAHIDAWGAWTGVVLGAAFALSILGAFRLRAIARLPQAGPRQSGRLSPHLAAWARRTARWWLRLFVGVTALYLLWEHVEALRAGVAAPGLSVPFSGPHGAALPLIALASLIGAAVVALADWCRCALAERLRAIAQARRRTRRDAPQMVTASDRPLACAILARRSSGRSPPY